MAVQQRIPMKHSDVFPNGAYLKGAVEPIYDFEKSDKDRKVQAVTSTRTEKVQGS